MAHYPDRGRDDVELFAGDLADDGERCPIDVTEAFRRRQLMDDLDARQVRGQWLAAALWAVGCGNTAAGIRRVLGVLYSGLNLYRGLRLVEQANLIRGGLLAARGIAFNVQCPA